MAGVEHQAEADAGAETGAGADLPYDPAVVAGRAALDLSLIAQGPEDAESPGPSLEEPWDAHAADELVRIYASGEAGLARPLSSDAELQAKLARTIAQAVAQQAPTCATARDEVGLEARLAGIARTIEASLTRLGHSENEKATLQGIEAQLDEIKARLSEGRLAAILEATRPSDEALRQVAETAAQKTLQSRRAGATDLAATARLNERSGEIYRLMKELIEEQRQSGRQTSEALETMQQAMQHILERIDAIEVAQTSALETLPEPARDEDDAHHEGMGAIAGSMQEARIRAGFAAPGSLSGRERETPAQNLPWNELSLGDYRSATYERHTEDSVGSSAGASRLAPHEVASREADKKPIPTLGLRATSTSSDARDPTGPNVRPGVLLAASLAAFLLAGYWLASGPKLRLPDETGIQSTQRHPGSDTSPTTPPPLRLFSATPDLDGSRSSRRARTGLGASEQAIEHGATREQDEHPETQARNPHPGAIEPRASNGYATPDNAETLPGPAGVVIDQGSTALSAEELLRLRQRQRMANISTRMGQRAAEGSTLPLVISARRGDAQAGQGAHPSEERAAVELPPLMVGPHSLRHAAATGDALAQFEVAARLAEGKGIKQDLEQAAKWYQRAAAQGLAVAQYRLAALYERGLGVPADLARAKAWYRRAAEQGNLKAMHNLAVLSAGNDNGDAAAADYATAAQWFGEAAARGLADSQYNLAVLRENGLGVPKNAGMAYKWYALSARSGDKEALRRRDIVKATLSDAALRAVDAEVAAWQPLPVNADANDPRMVGQAWQGTTAAVRN